MKMDEFLAMLRVNSKKQVIAILSDLQDRHLITFNILGNGRFVKYKINGIHQKYGIEGLLRYVTSVHECYISDNRKTPLRDLGDYMARHWTSVEDRGQM